MSSCPRCQPDLSPRTMPANIADWLELDENPLCLICKTLVKSRQAVLLAYGATAPTKRADEGYRFFADLSVDMFDDLAFKLEVLEANTSAAEDCN